MGADTQSIGTLVVTLTADGRAYLKTMGDTLSATQTITQQMLTAFEGASAAIATTVVAIGAAAVKSYADFEGDFVNSTANMSGATADMKDKMQDMAIQLSGQSTSSAQELAKAYGVLKNNGMDAAGALAAIGVADTFAVASHTELTTATDALAKATVAVGMASADAATNAKNMASVSDTLTTAARLGNGTMMDFAHALAQAGVQIRMLPGGFQEGAAVIAAYTKTGKSAEDGAQALAMSLRTLQQSAVKQPEMWQQYGMSIYNAAGQLKPFGDVLKMLQGNMAGLTQEQQRKELSDLGFQARTLTSIQSMLGLGDAIGKYQTAMENAGGATQTVADQQLATFNAQAQILWNNVVNILTVIGSQLVPVLEVLNTELITLMQTNGATTSSVKDFAVSLGEDLVQGIQLAMQAWQFFEGFLNSGQYLFLRIAEVDMRVYDTLVAVAAAMKALVTPGQSVASAWKNAMDNAKYDTAQFEAEIDKLNTKFDKIMTATPGDDFKKAVDDARIHTAALANATGAATAATVAATTATTAQTAALSNANTIIPEHVALINAIKYPWEVNSIKIEEYLVALEDGLKKGTVTLLQFQQAMLKLNLKGTAQDPFEKTLADLAELDAAYKHDIITLQEYTVARAKLLNSQTQSQTGIKGVDEIANLKKQITQEIAQFKLEHDEAVKWKTMTNAELEAMDKAHAQKVAADQQQLLQSEIGSYSEIAAAVTGITSDMFGKQSGAYKAMFDIQKSFAIASATMNMFQAIASAFATQPFFPLGLAMAATAATDLATIVSNIEGMSFEGGGDTGMGARVGGLDGAGGFMAMLHPQEVVSDLTRGQRPPGGSGGSSGPVVNVHNYTSSQVSAQPSATDAQGIDIIIKGAAERVAKDIYQGAGPVSLAIQRSYNIRRGQPTP
jgi:TP901 family phage tail tape measure protein